MNTNLCKDKCTCPTLLTVDSLELVVTAFNINYGLPQPLLQHCRYLSDYSTLVGKVKEGIRLGLSRRDAIRRAVKFCLDNGIMGNYLVEHSEEVFNMLALEWNMDDALQARFDEGRDEGIEEVAVNMIRDGEPLDKILKFTKLSLDRIKITKDNDVSELQAEDDVIKDAVTNAVNDSFRYSH